MIIFGDRNIRKTTLTGGVFVYIGFLGQGTGALGGGGTSGESLSIRRMSWQSLDGQV